MFGFVLICDLQNSGQRYYFTPLGESFTEDLAIRTVFVTKDFAIKSNMLF